jgi:pantoate kinase
LEELTGRAFAPSAISNFFAIHYTGTVPASDLRHTGATGGGYMLSSGVLTTARVVRGAKVAGLRVVVNGDPWYEAATTRTAVELLVDAAGERGCSIDLDQVVGVPIGHGFGASAASALSAVMAVASALSLGLDRDEVAYFAHAADIICRTGLGTVSVIYKYGGAGVIVKAGAPGIAKVLRVRVPRGVRIVTASLAPYEKGLLLSSPAMTAKVNRLGSEAIKMASDLTLESLVRAGESFSEGLGIASPQVRRLARTAKTAGALGASQNMVGHAIHAVVLEGDVKRVASALRSDKLSPEVAVYTLAPGPAVNLD